MGLFSAPKPQTPPPPPTPATQADASTAAAGAMTRARARYDAGQTTKTAPGGVEAPPVANKALLGQ